LSSILYFRIPAIGMAILSFVFATISIIVLQRIYIKNKRDIGKTRFVILYGLLIPILIVGSIIFFTMSFKFK
jgi:amino acid permease